MLEVDPETDLVAIWFVGTLFMRCIGCAWMLFYSNHFVNSVMRSGATTIGYRGADVEAESDEEERALRAPTLPDEYVLSATALDASRVDEPFPNLVQRRSLDGKALLINDSAEAGSDDLDAEGIAQLVRSGALRVLPKVELLELLLRRKENCGVGLTPGGDCAGISDFFYALEGELRKLCPEKNLLAVPEAGKGLLTSPTDFLERLVYFEGLAASDLQGMPGTPFKSSRGNPLKVAQDRVVENLKDFGFLYGTGGNGGLQLFRELSNLLPNIPVVTAPKTIDGDVGVMMGGVLVPIQTLGFSTAAGIYRSEIWGVEVTNQSMSGVNVVEVFGRDGGRLAYESAKVDMGETDGSPVDSRLRKIIERRADAVMVLIPEKPVNLERIAAEVGRIKRREGHCTLVVAEGFMPPELQSMILDLAGDESLRQQWVAGRLDAKMLRVVLERKNDSVHRFLTQILEDREQAEFFLNMLYGESGVSFAEDNKVVKIPAIRRFVIEAIKKFFGERPRRTLLSYEARGALPDRIDSAMGRCLGEAAAREIVSGVPGGRMVYYPIGAHPYHQRPSVIDLSQVRSMEGLNVPDEVLRANGVFW